MLDYTRQRAIEVLKAVRKVVLATGGPAGLQASEVACQAMGLTLYLLIPQTSDHLYNLKHQSGVSLLADAWSLKGEARLVSPSGLDLELLSTPGAEWCRLVRVDPYRVEIRRPSGWGNLETFDLTATG